MDHFQMGQFQEQFHRHPLIGGGVPSPKDNDKLLLEQALSLDPACRDDIAANQKVYVCIGIQCAERMRVAHC